jgi:lysozyme
MSKLKAIGAITGALALGTSLVAGFEGLRTRAYLDPVGIPTICYGHTNGVMLGMIYEETYT